LDGILDDLARHRLVPVLVIEQPTMAEPLAASLLAGGLPIAEVTLRTPAALKVIERMADEPSLLVGAGTVLNTDQVERAAGAGARFIVSPGFDLEVVQRCQELDLLPIPGIATATELQAALRAGVQVVKFFPAGALGGVASLRALAAPFAHVRFVPTGGIGPDDVASYLEIPAVLAVGGSFVVPARLVNEGDWDAVTRAVHQAVALVTGEMEAGTNDGEGGSR
jgi:2-dehydro-3-deoxyphosphogluconate aldolase / (4S)-4-hydroxy-2-oxoglutarate aldolase